MNKRFSIFEIFSNMFLLFFSIFSASAYGVNNSVRQQELSPLIALDAFISNANLPHQCNPLGKDVQQCRQACTPVKKAAYELRELVYSKADVNIIQAKAEDINRYLKVCAPHLPVNNKQLAKARKFNRSLLKKPDVFSKWQALGIAPINKKNDSDPKIYLNILKKITADTLKYCAIGGVIDKCSPACESLARNGKELTQFSGDLPKQIQLLKNIEKMVSRCEINNFSPYLPAIKELSVYVQAHPEFLYTNEQLAAVLNAKNEAKEKTVPINKVGVVTDVPVYPLSVGYTITTLNKTMRKRVNSAAQESVDIQSDLNSIKNISRQSCKKSKGRDCSQVCNAIYSYASNTNNMQSAPLSIIRRGRIRRGASSQIPNGAINFLDKAANCLNTLQKHKIFDENVQALLRYFIFIESSEAPQQPGPPEYLFYASRLELQRKVAACKANNEIACVLSCMNALSVHKAMMTQVPKSRLPRLKDLESLLDGYIEQCHNNYVNTNIVEPIIGDKWTKLLLEKDFAPLVDWEGIKTAKIRSQAQDRQLDQAYQFISKYQPEPDAPGELKTVNRSKNLSLDYKTVMDAFLTIQNYCPQTGDKSSCPEVRLRSILHPISALYDFEQFNNRLLQVLNNFVGTLGRSDNVEYDKEYRKGAYKLYDKYMALPTTIRPSKFKIIDRFVEDVLAMKPSVIVSNNHRFYCGEKGKQQSNPFLEYESCEFLSALYYRDFERLVSLEKLWVEPVLMKQAEMTEGQNNIIFDFLAKQNRTLLDNSEKTSMMPLVISSYLIDYNIYYNKCIQENAKVYSYQDTKVTSFKNRYGHTLYSSSSTNTRTYLVNQDWAKIFDQTELRLSEESVAMFSFIDSFNDGSEYTKAKEFEYSATRPSLRGVLTDLTKVMQKHNCDSTIAKKLDSRLQEFSNFRTVLGKLALR